MKAVASKKNIGRFIAATGKTENEYYAWASEVGRKIHINKLDALVCAKLNLYTVAHLAYSSTSLPEGLPVSEVDNFLIDNSTNPYELANLWTAARINAENFTSKESILTEHLRPIPKTDFESHGDRNHIIDVSRTWFKKDGINLDVQLMEINDMHLFTEWITLQDAIDFIMSYRPGAYKNPSQLVLERVERQFKAITTFQVKGYYVQHIVRMCEMEPIDNGDVPF